MCDFSRIFIKSMGAENFLRKKKKKKLVEKLIYINFARNIY